MSQLDSFFACQYDSFFCVLLNQLLIECSSDVLKCFDFFVKLKVYKTILFKKNILFEAIEVLLGSSYLLACSWLALSYSWSIDDKH